MQVYLGSVLTFMFVSRCWRGSAAILTSRYATVTLQSRSWSVIQTHGCLDARC